MYGLKLGAVFGLWGICVVACSGQPSSPKASSLGGGGANAAPGASGAGAATRSDAGAGAVVTGGPSAGGSPSSSGAGAAGVAGTAEGGAQASNTGFVHPGILLTSSDLARMKAKIASQAEPWRASFTTLAADSHSSASKTFATPPPIIGRNAASAYATTRYAAEDAAVTAFQNALVYALNGDAAHAAKVVEILNAYASTTQHFDGVDPERDLEAAILGFLWVSAAELIRSSDFKGWSAIDRAKFDAWIRGVVYADTAYNASGVLVTPLVNGAGARGAFGLRTKLAIGVYLDDHDIYDEAIDYFFNGQGNGAPHYYVKPDTGQTWEAGRDQGHAQGGLSRLVETAQIAYNQGNPSLYAWQDNALLRAVEYIASYNLGNDVPYSPMQPYTLDWSAVYTVISATGRGMFATIYELPYSYFHSTLGFPMPATEQAIAKEGAELFSAQNDNPMFATLSYRR